jgi:glutathione S-transferase
MAAKDISFAEVLIPLYHPNTRQQVLQYSPTGLVPALKYGNLVLWDSLAIIEYIAELHPEAKLWPEEMEFRALARSLSAEVHSGFQAFRAFCPMNLRRRTPRRLTSVVDAEVTRLLAYWKTARMEFGSSSAGPFLFGEFGAVDAMMAPLATRLRSYQVPVDRMTNEYIDAIYDLPAFQKWFQAAVAEPWKLEDVDNVDFARSSSR